jgi:hypothetical protein
MVSRQFILAAVLAASCAAAFGDEPVFSFLGPLRPTNTGLPPSLQDIEARLLPGHDFHSEDFITWAHEGTHAIDLRYNNMPRRAFYVLRGRVVYLLQPNIALDRLAAHIPPKLRGQIFDRYLVRAIPQWNANPLYVLHEWTAYTNGAQVRKELGWVKRAETEAHMAEMGVYVSALVSLTAVEDPKYDLEPLVTFVRWNVARGQEITGNRWNGLPAFVSVAEAKYAPAIDLMDLKKD